MRYYIIAGEASGDLHASNLVKAIAQKDSTAVFRGWGGDLMQQTGVHLIKHYKELAFMGFLEVLLNLRTIFKNLAYCKKDILSYKPDVVILVDYPGFNLRMAAFLKKNNIKVFYYISPQVWAWKESRVRNIKRSVDKMFVILPFEKDFYSKWNYDVDFVGHPLLDAVNKQEVISEDFRKKNNLSNSKKIIALLPGSRKQEISKMLPLMSAMSGLYPDYEFVIAGVKSLDETLYKDNAKNNCKIIYDQTYPLLFHSYAALVTSGTATLETAIFKVPEVVCYKGNLISYFIGRMLVKVKYISLVNLIMDKEVVKELIQHELNIPNLKKELDKLLDENNRVRIISEYQLLYNKLGGVGASERTAELMLSYLR